MSYFIWNDTDIDKCYNGNVESSLHNSWVSQLIQKISLQYKQENKSEIIFFLIKNILMRHFLNFINRPSNFIQFNVDNVQYEAIVLPFPSSFCD